MAWFPLNRYIWDFWFAWQGETLHLFYLQADPAACGYNPDRRHDRATVGHAVRTAWGWHALAAPALTPHPAPHRWDNLAIWTGSIIQHPETDTYYFFYTSRCRETEPRWTPHGAERSQQIGLALSSDLHEWKRWQAEPILPNPGTAGGFDGVAWRDPDVVQGEAGQFYSFICGRSQSLTAGGRIAYHVSDDLIHWSASPQLLYESTEFYQMEVPQVFWRREGKQKRLYVIFCAQAGDCDHSRYARLGAAHCVTGTYYLHSDPVPLDTLTFPPLPTTARCLAPNLYAGKLLNPTAANPLFFGFYWADQGGHFANGLAEPQVCHFAPDGAIALSALG
ncbi:hypothetical protein [Spirulina major]|uniref:hypothetical protein n=1 Tax=Spirulina major TaxID=270636 RepID=UPI000933F2F1|nr:hypothetical protein [Spirulina major]